MKPLLIQGGRIIDPARDFDDTADLLLDSGRIAWQGTGVPPCCDYAVMPAAGLVICPGLIDLHSHLREPGFPEKETIASGTRAAARGGFTTIGAMPNTEPPPDSAAAIRRLQDLAAAGGCIRVLPVGCVTRGRLGEEIADLAALAAAGAIGFSDDGAPVTDAGIMLEALRFSRLSGRPVMNHCEYPDLTAGGQMNAGPLAASLGLRGISAAAEDLMISRDISLAHLTGGHIHILHASTAGAVEFIRRGKEAGVRVTAEATPHHLTLTEDAVRDRGTSAKVKPPLRSEEDRQALVAGLKEGVIDIIATDHAPHTAADKEGPFSEAAFGISGLETALGSLLTLVHSGQLPLTTVIGALTARPARILNNRAAGTLAAGAPADITVFDPNQEWRVDPNSFNSKGKNTPLAGRTLRGKVLATFYGGEMVYRDNAIRVEMRL